MIKNIISKILLKLFNPPEYRKIHIYIVDDIIFYASLVKANLEKEGYENITLFYSGEVLLESLSNDSTYVDVIVLDYKLSNNGLNGDDVLNKLMVDYPDIKVLILSGQEDLEIAAKVMKLGAYDYIVKNDMAFFNLLNKLSVLEDSINEKEKSNWLDRRIKFLYILLIILIWILGIVFVI
ncbi:MAG: response regulator [bacterium]